MPRSLHRRPRMLASLRTAAVFGVEACPVHVEVDVSFGLPKFVMVGLPDTSVRESRERVRLAIRNSGFEYPPHRITVNLSPADVRKAGAAFVLPIAVGARRDGLAGVLLPAGNVREAAIVSGIEVVGVASLGDAVRALNDPDGFRQETSALAPLSLPAPNS